MKNKLFYLVLSFAVVFGVIGFAGAQNANAQTASFPEGCSSALGYSVRTGDPCNGTSTATIGPIPGCTTALGYSTVDGDACSGGDVAISYLGGCTSIFGYSTATGMPCNGTTVVSTYYDPGTTGGSTSIPSFPRTGFEDNALNNIILLATLGLMASLGFMYAVRPSRKY